MCIEYIDVLRRISNWSHVPNLCHHEPLFICHAPKNFRSRTALDRFCRKYETSSSSITLLLVGPNWLLELSHMMQDIGVGNGVVINQVVHLRGSWSTPHKTYNVVSRKQDCLKKV